MILLFHDGKLVFDDEVSYSSCPRNGVYVFKQLYDTSKLYKALTDKRLLDKIYEKN